jgi:hypothetical protein
VGMSIDPLLADCRRYWLAGRCPCCGSELCEWPAPDGSLVAPETVAEGVVMCGRCIGNHHHEKPGEFLPLLLESLLPPGATVDDS